MLNKAEGNVVNKTSKKDKDSERLIACLAFVGLVLGTCLASYAAIVSLGFIYGLQEVDAPYLDIVDKVTQVQALTPSKDRTEFLNIVENAIENEYLSLNEHDAIESMYSDLMLSVKIEKTKALLSD